MNYCRAGIWLLCILTLSCQNEQSTVLTYDLSPKTYVDKIECIGRLASANNYTITVPRLFGPGVKVAELTEEGLQAKIGDTLCKLESPEIQGFYDQYYDELEKGRVDLIKQEANNAVQVSLLKAQLKENELTTELTKLDSVQLKFAPPVKKRIMELEIEKNAILKRKITKKLEAQQRINEQTVRALKSQIIQKEQMLQRFQDMLDQLIIIAPKEGMIVHSDSPVVSFMIGGGGGGTMGGKTKVGISVMQDMPLIELPDLDSMQVIVMLMEADYKRVEKGQKVIIKPESIGEIEIPGTIKSKSLTSKPLSREFKVKTYEVVVDVDSLDHLVLPGLSAKCEIIIEEIADTTMIPSISIFEKDSSKIVYVLKEDLFYPTTIETGISNRAETIISKGLTGNETIALMEPPYKLIDKTDKTQTHEK